jgi:hypothetical protein
MIPLSSRSPEDSASGLISLIEVEGALQDDTMTVGETSACELC